MKLTLIKHAYYDSDIEVTFADLNAEQAHKVMKFGNDMIIGTIITAPTTHISPNPIADMSAEQQISLAELLYTHYIQRDNKIATIKLLRQIAYTGLLEAKQFVDVAVFGGYNGYGFHIPSHVVRQSWMKF